MRAEVIDNVQKSSDVFMLTLHTHIEAKPGQFVLVFPPQTPQRAYSIVKNNSDNIYLGIKKGKETSLYLSTLQKGDFLEVKGPYGHFTPRECDKVTLVAGGIGVTPLVSLYSYYKEKGIPTKVLYSAKGEFPFSDWFDNPILIDTLTQPRITPENIDRDSHVFICGPDPMINSIRKGLIRLGHDPNHIYSEVFL